MRISVYVAEVHIHLAISGKLQLEKIFLRKGVVLALQPAVVPGLLRGLEW